MISARINLLKVVKIAAGAVAAIVLAERLQLSYAVSAGVITLLTIQNTKKETLAVTGKRMAAFAVALLIAGTSFSMLGYGPVSLGVFLFLYSAFCLSFSLESALSINTVLITHFYAEQSMAMPWVRNECLLLLVGSGIGILLNLYMPSAEKKIREDQHYIETEIRNLLELLSDMILHRAEEAQTRERIETLEYEIKKAKTRAYENMENTLRSDTRYYIRYMEMRNSQCRVLKKMEENIRLLNSIPDQAYPVADFLKKIGISLHEYNNAVSLLKDLELLTEDMKGEDLPASRSEFENRAVLYGVLLELEAFLQLKRDFVEELTQKQRMVYWNRS